MFYVIGSENSKSGSAFLLLPPTEPKAWWSSSALPVYRYRVGWTDLWWNIGIQLCHHYTDTSLIRQVSEWLSLYSEFQRAIFNGIRKRSLYWLGHLGANYQRVLKTIFIYLQKKHSHSHPVRKFSFQVVADGNGVLVNVRGNFLKNCRRGRIKSLVSSATIWERLWTNDVSHRLPLEGKSSAQGANVKVFSGGIWRKFSKTRW